MYNFNMPITDQGVSNNRYRLIPRTLTFIIKNNCVLLIKGAATKRLWSNLYNGVGGHVERSEDISSAAVREIYEETGFVARNLRLCGVITIDTGPDLGVCIFVFCGEEITGEMRQSEEGRLEWVPFEKLEKIPLVEDLPIVIPRIIGSKPQMSPFSAHYQYNDQGELKISFFNADNS